MAKMTKEELAAQLDGWEYHNDFPKELLQAAKESKLLIIYGGSDDLVCFAGAFQDEADASDGGTILLSKQGIPTNRCADENCPYDVENRKEAIKYGVIKKIDVYWCGKCRDKKMDELAYGMLGKPTWCYDMEAFEGKFAAFDIFDTEGDDREYYCLAAVLDLNAVWPSRSYESLVM